MSKDAHRTDCARLALESYLANSAGADERQFAIIDLITDLLHLADQAGLDADHAVTKAELHFRAERLGVGIAA